MKLRFVMPVLLVSLSVHAENAEQSLLEIMQQLDRDTGALTSAMMVEDWETMERTARAIADHPKVLMSERVKILGHLGADASRFVAFDHAVHDAAVEVAEAATQQDIRKANAAHARIIGNCVACHATFRERVQELKQDDATVRPQGGAF